MHAVGKTDSSWLKQGDGQTTCFVVWLRARLEEYMRRLTAEGDIRPIAHQDDAMADLRRILTEREELYSQAHASIDTNGKNIEDCVAELMRITRKGLSKTMNDALAV